MSLLRLHRPLQGQVLLNGVDLAILSPRELREQRREVQLVFQNPLASLDPTMTVGKVVAEPLQRGRVIANDQVYMDYANVGSVQIGGDEVIVCLDKRAHNPYLVASRLTDQPVSMPWFGLSSQCLPASFRG